MPGIPAVAIVMRTYDRPQFLSRALASVVRQSFGDWALVVVNNGGDPGPVRTAVKRIVPTTLESRVTIVDTGARLGMEAASNIGLKSVDSEYFVIHDDDDTWEPGFLAAGVAHLRSHPDDHAALTGVTRVWERMRDGVLTEVRSNPMPINAETTSYAFLIGGNLPPPICILFRRSVLSEIGDFDESLPVLGDWEFNLRFLERFRWGLVPDRLARYHTRTADSDRGTGNSVTEGLDLHRHYKRVLQRRWDDDVVTGSAKTSVGGMVLPNSKARSTGRSKGKWSRTVARRRARRERWNTFRSRLRRVRSALARFRRGQRTAD